ncbi:MAG TPA: SRPBCC domain-containing protein [Prolixibacteraceae bacterium]
MKTEPYMIEKTYKAPLERVWNALTDIREMKSWYFDIPDFMPVPGFEFRFVSGPDESRQYVHLCQVTEVIPGKKIAYTWRYEGYEGNTLVSFELFDQHGMTRLKLTHEGLESFPQDNPDFSRERFEEGWSWIIGTVLKMYVEKPVNRQSQSSYK